jgi:hypothetical protein
MGTRAEEETAAGECGPPFWIFMALDNANRRDACSPRQAGRLTSRGDMVIPRPQKGWDAPAPCYRAGEKWLLLRATA